jgi:hypothetical protein
LQGEAASVVPVHPIRTTVRVPDPPDLRRALARLPPVNRNNPGIARFAEAKINERVAEW